MEHQQQQGGVSRPEETATTTTTATSSSWHRRCEDCDLSGRSSLEHAVDLSWMLTRYVCRCVVDVEDATSSRPPSLIGNALGAVAPPLEHHVRSDNVVIFMEQQRPQPQPQQPPSSSKGDDAADDPPPPPSVMTDAKFKSLIPFESHPPPRVADVDGGHSSGDGGGTAGGCGAFAAVLAPSPPPLRAALGRLLLDIFSKFAASSQSGVPSSVRRLVDDLMEARDVGDRGTGGGGAATTVDDALLTSLSLEDALAAADDARPGGVAIRSVFEAFEDLSRMRADPAKFLLDRTCPKRALEDTRLFASDDDARLVGREKEMRALAASRGNVSDHVRATATTGNDPANRADSSNRDDGNFLCEAFFLSGYAGCGKSRLVHSLSRSCSDDRWFVLGCKFSQQSSPHMVLAKAFDGFFGKWGAANNGNPSSDLPPELVRSFYTICTNIFNLMDDEALRHLCYLVPNFAGAFPLIDLGSNNSPDGVSSMDQAGSGRKRMRNLLHVLLKSICSVGIPVLFTLDDLQWSESHVLDDLSDFILGYIHDTTGTLDARQKGLLVVGTFRSNEVDEEFIDKVSAMEKPGEANVTLITIGDFSKEDVNSLVSSKLCLPDRYTRELADLVHSKTRGNVFFVHEFLRSIIRNKMLTYSVRYRRWIWDCDVVDMQMISDDVAQLLTTTFDQLPPNPLEALKVVSCLGFQVDETILDTLGSINDTLPINMREGLSLAVEEGIMEKAGPVYQFTHDILYQAVYELIPVQNRTLLHKTIGTRLLKDLDVLSQTLATDQINIFCKSATPSDEERLLFAKSNARAAKIAIAASSFDQARTYIDMGIQLLDVEHWQTQYSLSLDLFEMSASVSWAQGDLNNMPACLNEAIGNAATLDDTLKSSILLVKMLQATTKFEEAEKKCLSVLEKLGEEFPSEYDIPFVVSELASMKESLRNVSVESMKELPAMKDKRKLNTMKFLDLLSVCVFSTKPLLHPIVSCRMVKLTMQHGFCEDFVVGLAAIGVSIFQFGEDVQLASRIGKVAELLVEQSPKKHMLRSRLAPLLNSHLKLLTEPIPSALQSLPEYYRSAMMVGDVRSAIYCRLIYDLGMCWSASLDLVTCAKHFATSIQEARKYDQQHVSLGFMPTLNLCLDLSKAKPDIPKVLSLSQLEKFAEKSPFLLFQAFMCQLGLHFWREDYIYVAELSAKYQQNNQSAPMNRIMNIWRQLYEGISYFRLARDTRESKWKIQGEKAMEWMIRIEPMSSWNFTNKVQLLQAENHYLEGNLKLAEASYKSSIESANDHRIINEEALALELYGVFCVENQMFAKGLEHLQNAVERYEKWGALAKADQLREKIDIISLFDQVA